MTQKISKNLKYIEYTSESMASEDKKEYEKKLGVKIISNYGSREFWNIAYECEEGKMHFNDTLLSIKTDSDNAFLLTTRYQGVMKFNDYKIGDLGKIVQGKCMCGRSGRILEFDGTRDAYRIGGTNIDGNKLIRANMRQIIFKDAVNGVFDIEVIEYKKLKFRVSVWVDFEKFNNTLFIEKFKEYLETDLNKKVFIEFFFNSEERKNERLKENIFVRKDQNGN
ncbi:MAG: hypothetical protein ACRCUP_07055 [Mycoplasmatales bacterium]